MILVLLASCLALPPSLPFAHCALWFCLLMGFGPHHWSGLYSCFVASSSPGPYATIWWAESCLIVAESPRVCGGGGRGDQITRSLKFPERKSLGLILWALVVSGWKGKDGTNSRGLLRWNQWYWWVMEWPWASEERAESQIMLRLLSGWENRILDRNREV